MTFLLAELEELLELTQPQEFLNICEPLFRCISRCLMSPHFQVAERALFLWNNEYIVQQITNFKKTIFPIVFESLAKNAEGHWNSTVHGLTYNVQKLLMEMVRFEATAHTFRCFLTALWIPLSARWTYAGLMCGRVWRRMRSCTTRRRLTMRRRRQRRCRRRRRRRRSGRR